MADKVIGVDVGTNTVRAAEVALGAHPRLLRFGQVALPPGAVVEGEVADTAAVAEALRRLWREVGFKGKSVRVGIASARVILRIVEMPEMTDADTRSALRLQLGDYVPMAPEATMFGFQTIAGPDGWALGSTGAGAGDGGDGSAGAGDDGADDGGDTTPAPGGDGEAGGGGGFRRRRVLLAAAHQDAVRPLVDAVVQAGLKASAVDVIPAALARALAPAAKDVVGPPPVEAIVSLGAGTTLVVVVRGGTPLFARTVTTVSGRQHTERLAEQFQLPLADAERAKRVVALDRAARRTAIGGAPPWAGPGGPGDAGGLPADLLELDPIDDPDKAAWAGLAEAARPLVAELVAEVADSLDYYSSQPGAVPVDRVVLTGGGVRLPGAATLLGDRLGLPVGPADPFARVDGVPAGFEPVDLPYLAPYLPAAVGIALGGGKGTAARIDLLISQGKRPAAGGKLPLVGAAVAAVLVLAVAFLWWQRRGEINAEEEAATAAQTELAALAAAQAAATADPAAGGGAEAILRAALVVDPDWLSAARRLDEISAGLGVELGDVSGAMASRSDSATAATTTTTSAPTTSTTAASGSPTTTTADPATAGGAAAAAALGTLTLSGTADDLQTVAAWLDAVGADARFADAWITGVTPAGEGQSGLKFDAELNLTNENLVPRTQREAQS